MSHLAGKRAVVTGGTRGIGLEVVRKLHAAGAEVAFTGRKISTVERALDSLGRPRGVTGHAVDVREDGKMAIIVATGCDILINNAATGGPIAPLHETAPTHVEECLQVDAIAPLLMARLALTQMVKAGGGTIVNVSSGAAERALPQLTAYCTAKAALAMATRGIHAEYSDKGVRVFGFQPGIVDTDMQHALQNSGLPAHLPPPADKLLPPEQPAAMIAWLCTPEAESFAGREISIYDADLQELSGISVASP